MSDRRLALVVAVDRYDDTALRGLSAPTADAEALAEVLGDPDLGGFDVDVLSNATSWTTSQRVEDLLVDRRPSDLVLLHFSCHGLKSESGELYLASTNTTPERLASTAVEALWVNRLMQRSRAQRIVLLLDCCYGGAFERGLIARTGGNIDVGDQFRQDQLGEGRGRAVITASTAMEYAFEGPRLADGAPSGPSIFTSALVEGIRTGEADRDQDGYITLDELYNYVYNRVRECSPNQTPCKWEFGIRGGLYIARNPYRRIRPADLPHEVLDLVDHPATAARLAAVDELAQLAVSANLPRAAAARLALTRLGHDDSRRVSTAANQALERTAVRLTTPTIDFGRVSPGGPPLTAEVDVEGGPLAQASTVTTSTKALHARLDAATLRIAWTPDEPGSLDATVNLTGPAGETYLRVTAEIVKPGLSYTPPQKIPTPPRKVSPPITPPPKPVTTTKPATGTHGTPTPKTPSPPHTGRGDGGPDAITMQHGGRFRLAVDGWSLARLTPRQLTVAISGTLVIISLVVILVISISAPMDSSRNSAAKFPEGATVLANAATAMRTANTIRLALDVQGNAPGVQLRSFNGQVTRDGSGKGTAKVEEGKQLLELQYVIIGQDFYIRPPNGPIQKLPLSFAGTVYDPSMTLNPDKGIAAALASGQGAITEAREQVDGVDSYRLQVTFPAQPLGAMVPGLAQDKTSDIWVAVQGSRLTKAQFPTTTGGITAHFSDYDAPADIKPPA